MQFSLPLAEGPGTQQRHSTTLHIMLAVILISIGVACEGLYWFTATAPAFVDTGGAYRPFLIFGIAALLAGTAILVLTIFQKQWIRRERANLLFRLIELLLMGGSSGLFYLFGWRLPALLFGLMALVIVFALMRERRGTSGGAVVIDDTGIRVSQGGGRQVMKWKEIDRVLLRFGILTVECTGNRLVQRNVERPSFELPAFEGYCREQIEAHRQERVQNDW